MFASQGKTVEQAKERLERNIGATMCVSMENGKRPFENVPKAPKEFWDMFGTAEQEVVVAFNPSKARLSASLTTPWVDRSAHS